MNYKVGGNKNLITKAPSRDVYVLLHNVCLLDMYVCYICIVSIYAGWILFSNHNLYSPDKIAFAFWAHVALSGEGN